MESLVFAANSLYVVAYFTTDMLRLRLLTVTATSCLAVHFCGQPEPMWTVVGWNLFFVALNVVQIVRMIRRRLASLPGCRRLEPAGVKLH